MTLPFDLYVQILSHLRPARIPHDDVSVKTLVACLGSSTLLYQAASSSVIWEAHYRTRYTHPPPTSQAPPVYGWKASYFERRRKDYQALRRLDDLVNQVTQWDSFWLSHPFTFEEWDVLELEAQYHVPHAFRDDDLDHGPTDKPRSLAYGYWAQGLLRTIARTHAIGTLEQLLMCPAEVSFEDSHDVLSEFLGESPYRMAGRMEELAQLCRIYVESTGLSLSPESLSLEVLGDICLCICRFMSEQDFGPAEGADFTRILNSFPHACLSTHKRTIPLSLVHIFVSIATKLGLSASPVNFPGRVIARVTQSGESIYVDVYGSQDRAILPVSNDHLVGVLLPHNAQDANLARLSCNGADMLIRASRNIYSSSQVSPDYTVLGQLAIDTASYIAITLTGEPGLVHFLLQEGSSPHPLDSYVILPKLTELVRIANTRQLLRSAYQLSQDAIVKTHFKTRTRSTHPQVQHFVGMFFTHVKYHYYGCIIGWEPFCTASQQWIELNDVSKLARGKNQPFYTSIALNVINSGWSQTFVAEENIQPLPIRSAGIVRQFMLYFRDFGLYFEDVDAPDPSIPCYWRMLPSPLLRRMYPEDDSYGALRVAAMQEEIFNGPQS